MPLLASLDMTVTVLDMECYALAIFDFMCACYAAHCIRELQAHCVSEFVFDFICSMLPRPDRLASP